MKKINPNYLLVPLLLAITACKPTTSDSSDSGSGESGATTADYYVAVDGDDSSGGTADAPFASLSRARDAVRQQLADGVNQDIRVLIRGGRYHLDETVVFSLADSAADGQTITYAAYPGEEPVFSSALTLDDWSPLTEALPGLPEASQAHVFVAKLPEDASRFYSLYDGDGILQRSRGAGFKPLVEGREKGPRVSKTKLYYPEGEARDYENLEDVELISRGGYQWSMNILPIASVDEEKGIAHLGLAATYNQTVMNFVPSRPDNMWIEGVFDELDEPGEWAKWTERGEVYYFAQAGQQPPTLYAPQLQEYFLIQGEEGGEPVSGLVFEGLTLKHGKRDLWTEDDKGLQHDWEMWDKANGLIRFRFAEDCTLDGLLVTDSSGTGVRLDRHAKNITIQNSEFSYLGATGIALVGNPPGWDDAVRDNRILNNHIHMVGQLYWHGAAIFFWQSGHNIVAKNLIHHTPFNAISMGSIMPRWYHAVEEGRMQRELLKLAAMSKLPFWTPEAGSTPRIDWLMLYPYLYTTANVIEYNEIHNAQEVLGDGNAIYIRMCPPGNIVRRNYLHDIIGFEIAGAIRSDGQQTDVLYEENIIFRSVVSAFTLSFKNQVINNYLIDILEISDPVNVKEMPFEGYFKFADGPNTPEYGAAPLKDSLVEKNVIYHLGSNEFKPYSDFSEWRRGYSFREMNIRNNLFWWPNHEDELKRTLNHAQATGIDSGSVATDPGFADVRSLVPDFSVPDDSPLYDMGIKPLTLDGIGLDFKQLPTRFHAAVESRDFLYSHNPYKSEFAGLTQLVANFDKVLPVSFAPALHVKDYDGGHPETIQLVDGAADGGDGKVLQMKDVLGLEYNYHPLVQFDFKIFAPDDVAVVEFDLFVEEGQSVTFQTRAHPKLGKTPGPELQFRANGQLNIRKDAGEIGSFPTGEWMHVVMTAPLNGKGVYHLEITQGDEVLIDRQDLGYIDSELQQIQCFLIMRPMDNETGAIRVDNLKISRAANNT